MKRKELLIIIGLIVTVSVILLVIFLTNYDKETTTTYIVTFLTDGGSSVDSQTVNQGEKVIKPSDPIKEGYTFIEWTYKDQTYNFSLDVTSNLELKAKWLEIKEDIKTFTIKFDSDGGTTISNQIVEKGKKANEPDEPKKDGYTFKEWTLEGKKYDFTKEVSKDLELKAKWEKIKTTNDTSNNTNNKNNNSNNNKTNTSTSTNNNTNKPTENEVDNITVKTPTFTNDAGGSEKGVAWASLSIVNAGPYAEDLKDKKLPFGGYEVYEKKDGKYILLDTITSRTGSYKVTVDFGESKTLVARVYALNKSNKKIYSGYSNEIKIDNSTLEKPTLTKDIGGSEKGVAWASLSIVNAGPYAEDLNNKELPFGGYEVYEKKDGKYILLDNITSRTGSYKVTVDFGESKTLVARVYALNKSNKKVYSGYSNEIKIDNSTLEKPTLTKDIGGSEKGVAWASLSIVNAGPYAEDLNDKELPFGGYEVYEKKDGKYILLDTITSRTGSYKVTVDFGESKTLVARVYAFNKSNKKVYSGYSNEIKIDNSTLEKPTLTKDIGGSENGVAWASLSIVNAGPYAEDLNDKELPFSGYEVYEKKDGKYILLDTITSRTGNYEVTVNFGESKTLVARVYALNKSNKKVYSDYSNEVVVRNDS